MTDGATQALEALGQDSVVGFLGLHTSGSNLSEMRAEVVGEMAGRVTDGLDAFARGAIQLDDNLNWSASAGFRWRF